MPEQSISAAEVGTAPQVLSSLLGLSDPVTSGGGDCAWQPGQQCHSHCSLGQRLCRAGEWSSRIWGPPLHTHKALPQSSHEILFVFVGSKEMSGELQETLTVILWSKLRSSPMALDTSFTSWAPVRTHGGNLSTLKPRRPHS